jgi:hypothetical protein
MKLSDLKKTRGPMGGEAAPRSSGTDIYISTNVPKFFITCDNRNYLILKDKI